MTNRPITTPPNPSVGGPSGPLTVSVGPITLPPVNSFLERFAKVDRFKDILQEFLPAVQRTVIWGVVQGNFERLGKQGLEEAARLGQRGVVLKVEALVAQSEAGPVYSIRGGAESGGVHIIGVGPDANSICAKYKCHDVLEQGLTSGVSRAEGSGYVFLRLRPDGQIVAEGYDIKTMNQRSQQVAFDVEVGKATLERAHFQALSDYAEMLQQLSMDQASKAQLDGFITQRQAAHAEYQQINRTLVADLEKARRAGQLAKSLSLISSVFSLASAVSMATAQLGEAPKPKDPRKGFVSYEELLGVVDQMYGAFNDNIKSLQKQLAIQAMELNRTRQGIRELGEKLGRDPGRTAPLLGPL